MTVFLSYSSRDKSNVLRLAEDLRHQNVQVWLDEWEIKVGDRISQKIQDGLAQSDFIAVWLTRHAVESGWVECEWQSKYREEVSRESVAVLPLLAEECEIPILLRDKRYADFRTDYDAGLRSLLEALPNSISGRNTSGKPNSPRLAFPIIRVHEECLYTEYEGEVRIHPFDLESSQDTTMRFLSPGVGGQLKESYPFGIYASPRKRKRFFSGTQYEFTDPAFEIVVRNSSETDALLSKIGMSLNVKVKLPFGPGFKTTGIRVPFDDVRLDTTRMAYGETRFSNLNPVVLPPQTVHGIRIQLTNWEHWMLHVVQFIFCLDDDAVETEEIFVRN